MDRSGSPSSARKKPERPQSRAIGLSAILLSALHRTSTFSRLCPRPKGTARRTAGSTTLRASPEDRPREIAPRTIQRTNSLETIPASGAAQRLRSAPPGRAPDTKEEAQIRWDYTAATESARDSARVAPSRSRGQAHSGADRATRKLRGRQSRPPWLQAELRKFLLPSCLACRVRR